MIFYCIHIHNYYEAINIHSAWAVLFHLYKWQQALKHCLRNNTKLIQRVNHFACCVRDDISTKKTYTRASSPQTSRESSRTNMNTLCAHNKEFLYTFQCRQYYSSCHVTSVEQRPSWEPDGHSTRQEIPALYGSQRLVFVLTFCPLSVFYRTWYERWQFYTACIWYWRVNNIFAFFWNMLVRKHNFSIPFLLQLTTYELQNIEQQVTIAS